MSAYDPFRAYCTNASMRWPTLAECRRSMALLTRSCIEARGRGP